MVAVAAAVVKFQARMREAKVDSDVRHNKVGRDAAVQPCHTQTASAGRPPNHAEYLNAVCRGRDGRGEVNGCC